MQDKIGDTFPVGLNSLRLSSPCYLLVKPGILAACIAPHQYLSGAAISPPVCIHRTLRPNDSSSTCIGNGIFHPFHHHASWRTSNITSLPNQVAQRIGKVPPHTDQDDLRLEMRPCEVDYLLSPNMNLPRKIIRGHGKAEALRQN